jgi:hypothetical protein
MQNERADVVTAGAPLPRTGPVGRVARAVGAVAISAVAYEWIEAGTEWFSQSSTAANPMVWAVTVLAGYYGLYQFPEFAFGRPWGKRMVTGFTAALATVVIATIAIQGELWAAPLTTTLFWLGVSFLIAVAVSYLVAIFLGTPGCEVGGLAELVRRIRHTSHGDDHDAMWCVAGLHHLDKWEADRRRRAPV